MIVLALVVLLTGLALAYFSRTTTDRQLAQASYNDTSADLFARSALDIVVGSLKQEILNGGTTVTRSNIQPQRSGDDASIPNLIRRSVRNDGIPAPGISSLASAITSGPLDPNNVKRGEIRSARWNRHYLVPRLNTGNAVDSTPILAFVAPDWVLVTRSGPVAFSGWLDSLKDTTSTNYVVGRYAFAVYDEGGLLDMSLAGFPSWSSTGAGCNPAPTPWLNNVGYKGTVGFADLTALGTYAPPPTQIDNIVGWRNYATTQRTGATFGSFSYTGETSCTTQDSYGSYLLDFGDPPFTFDVNDQPVPISNYPFSAVYPTTSNSRTDQALVTRQELLRLLRSVSPELFSQNVLQYIGTFSRERNRPAPDWPSLQNNLSEGRFCFDNLDLVKPNPDNCTQHGRGKGQGKSKGRGHLCGTQADIVNLFGLLWIKATQNADGSWNPGHWRYIAHNGPTHNPNPNAIDHIPPFRGPNQQNDFFQILDYALFRVNYGITGDYDPIHLAKTFAIGASLIDQYDSDTDDLDDFFVPPNTNKRYQTHTTVIEYGSSLAYGMETSDANYGTGGNVPHRPQNAPTPMPNTYVMNHAFANVGQLGYGMFTNVPGLPTLDLRTASSSDGPLVDFFSYNPVSSLYPRAGIVNLNTKNAPVLAAIIKGASPTDGSSTYVNQTQATNAAQAIVTETTARPALTRGDVARLTSIAGGQIGSSQEQQQTIARSLAELGQTRTWNLLIDVIAQTGHYGPNSQGLPDFIPEGEKRYWLHIALGRDLVRADGITPCQPGDTGCRVDVLGTQLEEVIE
jgi:hypothetical protein